MKMKVPHNGRTAAQVLKEVRKLPPLGTQPAARMKKALADQRDPKRWRDPWKAR